MGEGRHQSEGQTRVGDLISISRAPAVVSLSEVEALRNDLYAGRDAPGLQDLLGNYYLGAADTKAAFDAMIRSLGRAEARGDAFVVQGVYGSGKSHLLAALTLLCGHPQEAWPIFVRAHPEYRGAVGRFADPRLVIALPLDEYSARTHSLEHIVLSQIEKELARAHDVQVALTEESYLLELVDRYVAPQCGEQLDAAARAIGETNWQSLREQSSARAAEVAVAFIKESGFPLDWKRSRAEAWGVLRRELAQRRIGGAVVLLDELGMFLAAKDRRGLNADASFLQYLAQRTATEPCWLVCVTQRGLEEVGDIDRRTLRQMRDRFRVGFTLELAELGWVVEHRLVIRKSAEQFREAMAELYAELTGAGAPGFSLEELSSSYPMNPLALRALQRAAETCLSRTRSAVRTLQEAAEEREWLKRPVGRLITPEAIFDLARDDMACSAAGQRHLRAHDVVMAGARRIAPGRERLVEVVMKTLVVLGLGGLRWTADEIRSSLVGCEEADLWRAPGTLQEVLRALYQWGTYVERTSKEGEQADEYFVEVSSDTSQRIRQRLNELVAELNTGDSRVARAAIEACHEGGFPLAGLPEPRTLAVDWWNARRYVTVVCRDLTSMTEAELQNLAGALESPDRREDGCLFIALPTSGLRGQEEAWGKISARIAGRFAAGLLAWLPRELTEREWEQLVEHAALAGMVSDRTWARRRDAELRARLRERWADSEGHVRGMLQRTYYEGRIADTGGEPAVEPERLSGLFGQWEETLATAFAGPFRRLFPLFASVAPERRLVGRAQTNQIIDHFVRPGGVTLPPASTLEAHLRACAAPLGLLNGDGPHFALAVKNREVVEAALEATPARSDADQIDAAEAIRYGELAGRLAKSEWGLVGEQSELLVAALIRTGYLVALDAFLQPVRLEAIGAPLRDNLPYVMRASALTGALAGAARALWVAAMGEVTTGWDLVTQERAWGEMIAWAAGTLGRGEERRDALTRTAQAFGHQREAWLWVEESLAIAEEVARGVDASRTSREGLARMVEGAARLPGGVEGTAETLERWRKCERFLDQSAAELAAVYRLLSDARVWCPKQSLLARRHREVLDEFASPKGLIGGAEGVNASARRWLETYRRHYLAWHQRLHGAARFEPFAVLRGSATMEAVRRLARAGLLMEESAKADTELNEAIKRRCLAGDPLPAGYVVCPACGIRLGEEMRLPQLDALTKRAEGILDRQREELRAHEELLRRRLVGCGDERVKAGVERVLVDSGEVPAAELSEVLSSEVIAWLRQQLAQPRAKRRELSELESKLRGKEMTKAEIVRTVEEWLGREGDEEVIEVI